MERDVEFDKKVSAECRRLKSLPLEMVLCEFILAMLDRMVIMTPFGYAVRDDLNRRIDEHERQPEE